jgi:DNA-directed RNA polymerase subunit N (RpoN/RPB10)
MKIQKYAHNPANIRRSRKVNKRRSPEQILQDLGMTRESVQKAITDSQVKYINEKVVAWNGGVRL